jgi:K+-transporting ATPase ATPase A chain
MDGRQQAGGNMEGKEVRFGIANSALFATATTDASCGAVNSMHDSFTPLGGMIPLLNIMLGEIIFGGAGAGMYGMLVMVVLTVFIAGLMVGRTPEYLGKKIEAKDVKMAMLYVLVFAFSILGFSAWSSVAAYGASKVNNAGPHGLSEIVYAFVSATGNNGSAFAGLNANTLWYNITIGFAMLIGRFLMIIPMMAIAGNLATKKIVPPSAGTFPVHTPLFCGVVGRRHTDRWRADLFPDAFARTDRGAFFDGTGANVLNRPEIPLCPPFSKGGSSSPPFVEGRV